MMLAAYFRLLFRHASILVTFVTLSLSQNIFASDKACLKSLEGLLQKRNNQLINSSNRIYKGLDLKFLNDDKLDMHEKSGQLFNLYVDRIKTVLKAEEIKELDVLIANAKKTTGPDYKGSYVYESKKDIGSIKLVVPSNLENTYLQYASFAHELELGLRQILSKRVKSDERTYYNALETGSHESITHMNKTGAMSAEWAYLSALPTNEVNKMNKLIKRSKKTLDADNIKVGTYSNLLNIMKAPELELNDYLKLNWKNKRYDFDSIKRDRMIKHIFKIPRLETFNILPKRVRSYVKFGLIAKYTGMAICAYISYSIVVHEDREKKVRKFEDGEDVIEVTPINLRN